VIFTHLALYSFLNGAGGAISYPSAAAILPASTGKLTHARILREFRDQYVAARIHNILKETTV
jgi:hypothetical protein